MENSKSAASIFQAPYRRAWGNCELAIANCSAALTRFGLDTLGGDSRDRCGSKGSRGKRMKIKIVNDFSEY
jgi:hypothetical protein